MRKVFAVVLNANIIFWLISNYACWLAWYPHDLKGFLMCYYLAIPFFFTAFAKTLIIALGILWAGERVARRAINYLRT